MARAMEVARRERAPAVDCFADWQPLEKEPSQLDDFRRLTLIGSPGDAVFDHMDRTRTSGLLMERDGRLYVMMGWNVGVFMLTCSQELITAGDEKRLRDPTTWLQHTEGARLRVRPTSSMHAAGRAASCTPRRCGRTVGHRCCVCNSR